MQQNHTPLRLLALTGGALALGLALTGCSSIAGVFRSGADTWQLQYEVTTDAEEGVELTDVAYLDMESRLDGQFENAVGTIRTEAGAKGADGKPAAQPAWMTKSLVIAGDPTSITATPPADVSATCRILLDGATEIAAESGAPGEPVHCAADAPQFDD